MSWDAGALSRCGSRGCRRKSMPFTAGEDPNRGRGPAPGTGGRPTDAARDRARELVKRKQVLERLADAAGLKKPNVPAARLLLQVAQLLTEQVVFEPSTLEALSDQELEARAEAVRAKVLQFRKRPPPDRAPRRKTIG